MKKTITKIAVTGGPCGGKSSLLNHVDRELSQRGYRVFLISESATDLILGGIKPFDGCLNMYDFQKFVFPTQFFREDLYRKAAELVPEEKVVILCDRGILDNKAYVSEEEFQTLLQLFGKNEAEVRDSYDAVIHLVTTADGAEHAYTLSNNTARTETPEQARAMEQRTLLAWAEHPHRYIIDNSTDFAGKIARAMKKIEAVLEETT
ncbi:MAG: ATP-binding protein [Eubacteriales bacterium]|nr:ATP-binding protein [Eubacteriales bacterium]